MLTTVYVSYTYFIYKLDSERLPETTQYNFTHSIN